MTDKNYTHIVTIIDRSGSMSHLVDDTIGGYNTFIEEQKKVAGKATITRVQFDDKYQIDYDMVDVANAEPLNTSNYVPRGMTALLDAVGKTVTSVGETLSKLEEDNRPGQVIFFIITDGQENSSREYKAATVKQMVKEQIEKYSWEFVYMGGGDIDSQRDQGESMGIRTQNVYTYNMSNTSDVYTTLSKGTSRRRVDFSIGAAPAATMSFLSEDEKDSLK